MTITVYTFEDRHGNETNSYETQNYDDAKQHASENGYRVIANEYEFAESFPLDDFTARDLPTEDEPAEEIEA